MTLFEPAHPELDLETRPRAEAVAPGVYAIVQLDGSWGLSNSALITSASRSVLVDTYFTERRNLQLREITGMLGAGPPSILVNTHHHGDHVHGNGWFPEALVVAHGSCRDAIAGLNPAVSARRFSSVDFGETRPTMPDLTFDTSLCIHAEDLTVDVIYPGVAHCAGNSVVHIPERRVLIAGDLLLKGCTPTFVGGSALGFRAVLDRLRALDAEIVIPGHGPVCGPEVFGETEQYLDFVLGLAEDALKDGKSPLESARGADLGTFSGWHDSERLVGNLYRAMTELGSGEAFETAQMWRDTEEYLGRPVRSRA